MPRRKPSREKGRSGAGSLLLLLLVAIALAALFVWFVYTPTQPSKEVFVEIAPGSSSAQIAAQLESAGVVKSRYGFDLVRLWKRGVLQAGEYRFDQAADVPDVYSRIARGDVFTLAVTVPEGATRFDVADRMQKAGLSTREEILAATSKNVALIADLDPKAKSLEGYLFPDTYHFPRKATPLQIVTAMTRRFRLEAQKIGIQASIRHNDPQRTMHEVVTLASLTERETAQAGERPLVASVLTNRLHKNMPLMTDSAVIYGLLIDNRWRGTIYQSDLQRDTPYNTYRHAGLPPGPIANPGLAALEAALHPATTDYLYFVANGADPQGRSSFATTLEEHNKNVALYRQAVKQAGAR